MQRHWLLATGPTNACMVDDADAKYIDTGALGGHVTRTGNETKRLMVSLALLPPSWPKKRKAGLFSKLY